MAAKRRRSRKTSVETQQEFPQRSLGCGCSKCTVEEEFHTEITENTELRDSVARGRRIHTEITEITEIPEAENGRFPMAVNRWRSFSGVCLMARTNKDGLRP
jgi:hypothetical protein